MKFSLSSFFSFRSVSAMLPGVLLFQLVHTMASASDLTASLPGNQKTEQYQILMAGGGLQNCTYFTPEYCTKTDATLFADTPNPITYRLDKKSFEPVLQTSGFQQLDDTTQLRLKNLFAHFYAKPVNVNSPEQIQAAFKATTTEFDAGTLFSNLPNEVYYAILDYSQQVASASNLVDFQHTKNEATKNILREFVRQAYSRQKDNTKLTLSFVTAAARDPLAKVNEYQQLLEQVAFEELKNKNYSVTWLPLDQSVMQALEDKEKGLNACDNLSDYQAKNLLFNAANRYPALTRKQTEVCQTPEKLETLLRNSHGLFISDRTPGDPPSLRLLSLIRDQQHNPTVYQKIMASRQERGDIFIAGSGLGAAIMAGGVFANRPVPYLTGGTSEVALVRGAFPLSPAPFGCEKDGNCPYGLLEDDLTFESRGGTGGFTLGIIDTEFSKLSRHARLTVLTAASKTRFGFGIDANTALLFTQTSNGDGHMKVLGENGVFVVDMRDAIVKTQAGKHQIIAMSHYLNNADQLIWSAANKELSFVFGPQSERLDNKTMVLPRDKGEFRRNVAINCGLTSFHRWTESNIAWLVNPTEDTRFYRSRAGDNENCGYHNLLFGIEN